MKYLIAFALVIGAVFSAPSGEGEESTLINTCHGSACPPYTVAENYTGIEKRLYQPFTVPTYTSIPCLTWSAAQTQGYFHLSMYTRRSANADRKSLKMGVPVLLEAKHVDDVEERCSHLYSTSFYINEDSLPNPTNEQIKLKEMTELNYYVYAFDGIVRNPADKVLELRVKLNSLNLCYDTKVYYVASYSSPSSVLNNKYEIWVPVRSCGGTCPLGFE